MTLDSPLSLVIVAVIGLIAGVINTLSGGGSILTVGTLMALGMPANVANATNRVPILFQSSTGVAGYLRRDVISLGESSRYVPLVILGAFAGSFVAGTMDNRNFEPVLVVSMLAVALYMLFGGSARTADTEHVAPGDARQGPLAWLGLLAAGFYGGLVQAGVGLILLTVLSGVLRIDLLRANGLKLVAVMLTNIVSFAIFLSQGLIDFRVGLVMAVGTTLGAIVGVRISVSGGERWIRIVAMSMAIATIAFAVLK